jgi:sec-independent protein translocase protein TatB
LPLLQLRHYDDDMSFSETIFLFFLALIIFGPKKLPEIARQAGRLLAELRRASNEFRSQIEQEISHLETENGRKILAPSEPPQGAVASRSLNATSSVIEAAAQAPATLAASPAEAADAILTSVEPCNAVPATEAVTTTEAVEPPAPQESHA